MTRLAFDFAIVGSGLGGSTLARALTAQGHRVALLERERHPRFALGESSTPLASLSLERLATRYGLEDLRHLATHGLWQRHLPKITCGLKRGFTFVDALPDRSSRPLLVAASPDVSVADTHWMRSEVDAHLFDRARAEGVTTFEQAEVTEVSSSDAGMKLTVKEGGRSFRLEAELVIDATGGGFLSEPARPGPLETRSSLVFGHFADVPEPDLGTQLPYPPTWSAMHHLLEDGWMYELRFDDGRVSAGVLSREPHPEDAAEAWRRALSSVPALAARFEAASTVQPLTVRNGIQYLAASAVGRGWVALPHSVAFVDPLFSTGIAWTLLGVERLAGLLGREAGAQGHRGRAADLRRYDQLLRAEALQIDRLISGAYRALDSVARLAPYAATYFATVSWAESRQRLLDRPDPEWEGFLGVGDPVLETLFREAAARLPVSHDRDAVTAYWRWVAQRVQARDVMGIDRFGPSHAIPVDLEVLVERAQLLGLTPDEMRSRLPRLRSITSSR